MKAVEIKIAILAGIFLALLGILGVSVGILIKVNKKDDTNSPNGNIIATTSTTQTVTRTGTTQLTTQSTSISPSSPSTCPNPVKSTLPTASFEGSYDKLSWGTFRAPLYFGLRMRHESSPLFGLMWFKQGASAHNMVLKHYCEDDGVRCMWSDADGETFGSQPVVDNPKLSFNTDWIGFNRSWIAHVDIQSTDVNNTYSFIYYFAYQDTQSTMSAKYDASGRVTSIQGAFQDLGNFELDFSSSGSIQSKSDLVIRIEPMLDAGIVNELVTASFLPCKDGTGTICLDNGGRPHDLNPNFVAVQITVKGNASFEARFKPASDPTPFPSDFKKALSSKITTFRQEFEQIFQLQANGMDSNEIEMGRYGFANMIGSVSYWTGSCQVYSPCIPWNQYLDYGPLTLYSGIPSRPYYPRGFLWDEGFHNLLMRKYRPTLSLDIMASWLDMADSRGWIPREVVLDSEAHRRAPPLLFEDSTVANPPMFIYLMGKMMQDQTVLAKYTDRISKIYPRLRLMYTWLKTIQIGPVSASFQWQGRNATTDMELNPGTTPSGLDDYPRASHPSKDEYHVDIKCWMAMSSTVLLNLATLVNDTAWLPTIQADQKLFNDLELLDKLHWSTSANGYYDYGNHSYNVAIVGEKRPDGSVQYRREVFSNPQLRFVDDVYGYVNIFPFLLRLLPANNTKLQTIVSRLNDTEEIWTPFGLRSVSKRSRYYDAFNTDTAAPYWRGPIWININYLALEALKYYSSVDGPVKDLSASLYTQLKTNVVTNLANQYKATGFIWEHYDDKTGEGKGTRPFTGWSSLVLGIMGDAYN